MNDIKPMLFLFTALFILMIGMYLAANTLAKRISEGWLVLAAVILMMIGGTCFLAAYMRQTNERQLRHKEHLQNMEDIRSGKSSENVPGDGSPDEKSQPTR